MKTIILSLSLSFMTTASFAYSDKNLKRDVESINASESKGNFKTAAIVAVTAAHSIADELKFDEVIASIDSVLLEEQEEVITRSTKEKIGFSLFGLVSATGEHKYDTTKILLTNPDEKSQNSLGKK